MISVIIPVYNEEKTIKNTLDNLIASGGIEMIVVDGGSSTKLTKQYGGKWLCRKRPFKS